MRVFLSFVLLILVQAVNAAPSQSVFHAHAGRIHQHPLPVEGISHRHRSGQPGVVARSTNTAGTIKSTVVYGDKYPNLKIKSRPNGSISSGVVQIKKPHPSWIETHNNQTPAQIKNPQVRRPQNFTKGDANCRRGEADCNVCAANVQQQFKKASAGQISWKTIPWRFTWPQAYPPYNKRPLDIFDGDPAYALGIPDTHIQGFVRTNSSTYPYAGSHSHKKQGGVFVIRKTGDGKKYLSSLHPAKSRHPSGVQVLGKYLLYGEKNIVFFKDLNSPNQRNNIALSIPNANFGGGVGAIRLSRDNYLLVTSGPGGQKSGPRYNRFYHLRGVNGRPTSLSFLSQSRNVNPTAWPKSYGFSENLSLITECGTGDVYAVHTTGDEKGVKAIKGNGYWRLSKLRDNYGSPEFTPINAFSTRQNMSSCNVRASATVHVNNQRKLEFYCHGYAKDPDGSTFNVLGKSSRTNDKFNFKVGVVQ